MDSTKRNEWLDEAGASSNDDEGGYDSEAAEISRSRRPLKRRRLSPAEEIDNDQASLPSDNEDEQAQDGASVTKRPERSRSKKKTRSVKAAGSTQSTASKSGVVYLSRIPPYMKPAAVRHHLCAFGEIGRVFLTPEDSTSHTRRVRSGGNKKRSFVDGWVEFVQKKDAKVAAETLNAQIIGGKKGGWYHDDVWNMKYLKGFKWHHLTEQIANENAERAARLRTEIAQTTKENKRFMANVERAKMIEGIQAKRKTASTQDEDTIQERETAAPARSFRQNRVVDASSRQEPGDQSEVKRVLSKIF